MEGKFVAYYRVSTTKQGMNGLGMDAQKEAVTRYLNGGGWELLAEFSEVESGKDNSRVELHKAIELCRKTKATLLIAKLDRLTRNAAFLLSLRDSGVLIRAADMPNADNFTVGIMALVAQREREMISERTKAGLQAAKRRGTKLGNPRFQESVKVAAAARREGAYRFAAGLKETVEEIQEAGMTTLRDIAKCLNARGFTTPRGKRFAPQSVKDLLARI